MDEALEFHADAPDLRPHLALDQEVTLLERRETLAAVLLLGRDIYSKGFHGLVIKIPL